MTRHDVKNYLEKIYKVPVAYVKTANLSGKTYKNELSKPGTGDILKEDDYKVAFVTLPPGTVFEWPDLKIKENDDKLYENSTEDMDKAMASYRKAANTGDVKYRPGVPSFFGL